MWLQNPNSTLGSQKVVENGLVAVAIDKDKSSQNALKWALDHLLSKGQTVILIHVLNKSSTFPSSDGSGGKQLTQKLFLTFRCYCTRKDVRCLDIVLEDNDVVRAISEYVSYAAIETLVLGASHHGFMRKFKADIPSNVSKGVPDFCTTYVISKGKVSSVRHASRAAPYTSPILDQIERVNTVEKDYSSDTQSTLSRSMRERGSVKPRTSVDESFKSPFTKGRAGNIKSFADLLDSETDISFVSSGRPSTDRTSSITYEFNDSIPSTSRISTNSDNSFGSTRSDSKLADLRNYMLDFSSVSQESARTSVSNSSQGLDDTESEMRRLKLELKQTMEMYSNACREALSAKQRAMELQNWRLEEERRLEEARHSEGAALSVAEKERDKCRAAVEAAEAAKRLADFEAHRRLSLERKTMKEAEEMKRMMDAFALNDVRYRRYSIEEIEEATENFAESRKIGEGGYGPVYKCYLDHTPVAVKVLRPDAAQGRSQFQREVEVLSLIRHPNMVLLLGACPEYGILVYEYMARGSLDDRLFRRGNSPALSWQLRFRIAAEIATGLLFLHQTKPEPLVHRDLKPGNILLDNNYVSKVSDVGLARLVPAVAENVTQCYMTSTAGTFCYIDPEYQQTGVLGVKSDVYSLGIMLLQIITAKPPMGLTHHVEQAIENGTFSGILDPAVPDWPIEETLTFANLALQCAELRRKDRPDLGKVILPELNKLREFGEVKMNQFFFVGSAGPSPNNSQASVSQEVMSDPLVVNSGSSKSHTSETLHAEEQPETTKVEET